MLVFALIQHKGDTSGCGGGVAVLRLLVAVVVLLLHLYSKGGIQQKTACVVQAVICGCVGV